MMPRTGLIGVATLSLAIASPESPRRSRAHRRGRRDKAKAGALKAYQEGRKAPHGVAQEAGRHLELETWEVTSGISTART